MRYKNRFAMISILNECSRYSCLVEGFCNRRCNAIFKAVWQSKSFRFAILADQIDRKIDVNLYYRQTKTHISIATIETIKRALLLLYSCLMVTAITKNSQIKSIQLINNSFKMCMERERGRETRYHPICTGAGSCFFLVQCLTQLCDCDNKP